LPAYLKQSRWFTGRARSIYNVEIINTVTMPLPPLNAKLLLLEVSYESGLSEMYQLMVTFVRKDEAETLVSNFPMSVVAVMQLGYEEGVLCDALYVTDFQQLLFYGMMRNKSIGSGENSSIRFYNNGILEKYAEQHNEVKSKAQYDERYHSAITYDNNFYLTIYRKVDFTINPDAEITRFLSEKVKFQYIPAFLGAIEWATDKGVMTLGMMQTMVENHGNGYSYMIERLYNYIERILALDQEHLPTYESQGSLTEPVAFDQLPTGLKNLLGSRSADQAKLIGIRTGEMHLALASAGDLKDFKPEEFSLHYQRSLFSAMVSQVREVLQGLKKNMSRLKPEVQSEAEEILRHRDDILNVLKNIYSKKLDVLKIRIHGNYTLNQVLFTGKDIAIQGYGGDPLRPYSERRLKRSPLHDVASMLRSFHNAAYEGFFLNNHILKDNIPKYIPFARLWAHYMSGFFMKAYLDTVAGARFIPKDKNDFRVMLQTFLLEKALIDLNHSLNNGAESVVVPLRTIKTIIK